MKHNVIITISRQYGSGGHVIGKMLAERLGVPFYDKELISLAAAEGGFDESVFASADEQAASSLLYSMSMGLYPEAGRSAPISNMPLNDRVYLCQARTIKSIAAKGSCVIVGRCADSILAENPDVMNVFIHSDLKSRIRRVIERYGIPPEQAPALVQKTDKRRASYHDYYSSTKWSRVENYHLSLNSDFIGFEHAVDLIATFAQARANRD